MADVPMEVVTVTERETVVVEGEGNDSVVVVYTPGPQGPPGPRGEDGDGASRRISEQAVGPVSGENATFNSQYPFIAETLSVYLNGVRQALGEGRDYTQTNATTFIFTSAPVVGDYIHIEYNRA